MFPQRCTCKYLPSASTQSAISPCRLFRFLQKSTALKMSSSAATRSRVRRWQYATLCGGLAPAREQVRSWALPGSLIELLLHCTTFAPGLIAPTALNGNTTPGSHPHSPENEPRSILLGRKQAWVLWSYRLRSPAGWIGFLAWGFWCSTYYSTPGTGQPGWGFAHGQDGAWKIRRE